MFEFVCEASFAKSDSKCSCLAVKAVLVLLLSRRIVCGCCSLMKWLDHLQCFGWCLLVSLVCSSDSELIKLATFGRALQSVFEAGLVGLPSVESRMKLVQDNHHRST